MANTLQTALDLARLPLNDDAKDRYTDAKALVYCNQGLLWMYKESPQLWFDNWDNAPNGNLLANTPLPIDDQFIQWLADLITARLSMTDDEFISSGRVEMFIKLVGAQTYG